MVDHNMFTLVTVHISNGALVTSGVSQGSVIFPFLFAMVTGSFAPLDPSSVRSVIYTVIVW